MTRDGFLTGPVKRTLTSLELRYPPLPQTLIEAMELIDEPERLEVESVTSMVQRDPVVVARLLHLVNSAYYGLRHSIGSTERAVVMLGPVSVAGIVVGMNMLRLRTVLDEQASGCFQRLIRHSIATAFLARHLVEGSPRERTAPSRRGGTQVGVSFTAGLLHDFGKIILVYNFPTESVAFYGKQALDTQVTEDDERHLEQLLFGFDHTEAGEYVARKLNFPELLTGTISRHHEAGQFTGTDELDRILRATRAADLSAKAMGYSFTRPLSWETVAADPVWEALVELDQRGATPEHLIQQITAEQEHLDAYVQSMTAGASQLPDAPLPLRRTKR